MNIISYKELTKLKLNELKELSKILNISLPENSTRSDYLKILNSSQKNEERVKTPEKNQSNLLFSPDNKTPNDIISSNHLKYVKNSSYIKRSCELQTPISNKDDVERILSPNILLKPPNLQINSKKKIKKIYFIIISFIIKIFIKNLL